MPDRAKQLLFGQNSLVTTVQPNTQKTPQPMNKAQTCFWFGSPKRIFKPCLTEPNSYCLIGTALSPRFNRTHNYGSIEHTINLNQWTKLKHVSRKKTWFSYHPRSSQREMWHWYQPCNQLLQAITCQVVDGCQRRTLAWDTYWWTCQSGIHQICRPKINVDCYR